MNIAQYLIRGRKTFLYNPSIHSSILNAYSILTLSLLYALYSSTTLSSRLIVNRLSLEPFGPEFYTHAQIKGFTHPLSFRYLTCSQLICRTCCDSSFIYPRASSCRLCYYKKLDPYFKITFLLPNMQGTTHRYRCLVDILFHI